MAESLAQNPVFQKLASASEQQPPSLPSAGAYWRIPLNLVAHDGRGHLFLWNASDRVLHSVEIEQSGTPMPPQETLRAKKTYKTLQPIVDVGFPVRFMTFNRRGWLLLLVGDNAAIVVDVASQFSSSQMDDLTYNIKATEIGADKFYSVRKALRIVQVAWHPYSDTHIGVLSSDGVFRLFDLSLNSESPEQEYHVQSRFIDTSTPATYARPVAFAFGGEHLWDRFAVFMLFSNGSIYALCPVCPFGSLYNSSAIEELYRDACQWASSNATNSKAASNASLASAWLEAVFPSSVAQLGASSPLVLKGLAHVAFNASLLLQGPLPVIMGGDVLGSKSTCSSTASTLMYSAVGKDSILAISLKNGQMQVYALADELQPIWNEDILPRLQFGEEGYLVSVAMLVDTLGDVSQTFAKDGTTQHGCLLEKHDSVWTSQIPPLLQLAVIDFALPEPVLESAPLAMLADPIVPERLYCYHAAGIDAILLQWLPFSEQSMDKASSGKPPVVYPILDTCPSRKSTHLPLVGVAQMLDFCGEVWLIAITASYECVVIGMKSHGGLDLLHVSERLDTSPEPATAEVSALQVISKELLQGPKDIPIPVVSSGGRSLTLDTIEGRALLHDQCKLLHEKYIEYAHRVHVELTSHGYRLHNAVQEQNLRLSDVQGKVVEAFELSSSLTSRIEDAFHRNENLKDRLKHSSILAVKQKPLTMAELEYRSQLVGIQLHDLHIIHNAVDVLKDQFERQVHTSQASNHEQHPAHRQASLRDKAFVSDFKMNRLKTAVAQLTQKVKTALSQVKILDDMVRKHELMCSQ